MIGTDILGKIQSIEESVSGCDWHFNGVDVWPIYRNEIRHRISFGILGGTADARYKLKFSELARRQARINPADPVRGTTVLLNHGFMLQEIDGQVIDRICTPLALGLDRLDEPSVLLDQGAVPRIELPTDVQHIGAAIRRIKVAAFLTAKLSTGAWVNARCRLLRQEILALGLDPSICPSAQEMTARQRALFALARYFERQLARVNAKRVLQVCYYTIAGFAMNLAARRRQIPCIDIQHGVIDDLHPAYTTWRQASVGGYALLPTGYWAWNDAEAAVLRRSFGKTESTVVVGGHPLIEAWRANWLSGRDAAVREVRSLRTSSGGGTHALVTLQPSLAGESALRPLLEAMVARRDVFWWVRAHPLGEMDVPSVRALLEGAEIRFDLDNATRLPLYALLESVDVHLTHSSSAVIEAAQFGVPSLMWSRYGEELFGPQILAGAAEVGASGEAVLAFINANRVPPAHQAGRADGSRLLPALTALLGGPGAAPT